MESNQSNPKDSAQFAGFAWSKILSNETGDQFKDQIENSPVIPESVYSQLPAILKDGCCVFKNEREKDVFLTGAIITLSGCFANVMGLYDGKEVYPNLYCFIVAPAASGKGVLTYAKALGMTIHKQLLDETKKAQEKYKIEMKQYYANSKKRNITPPIETPKEPPTRLLFIPANNSSANVIKLLEQNKDCAIICETEADTMANSFKQDWGGYSDLLRKAFHHEAITYSRKTNNEYIEVSSPKLSVAISGTPSQVSGLIMSNEDGLFSRFLFYYYETPSVWRDVSYKEDVNYNFHFKNLADKVSKIHDELSSKKIEFMLTTEQWDILNRYHANSLSLLNDEMSSTIFRSGLITYRIAMVLTILRQGSNFCTGCKMYCDDTDLNTAITLTDVYMAHDLLVYKSLLIAKNKNVDGIKMKFYNALPDVEFSRKEAVEIGDGLTIKERTVGKYLKQFSDNDMLENVKFGFYKKK